MASTVSSLQAEIQAECAELGRLMDEEYRLKVEVGQSILQLLGIGLARHDKETIDTTATELITMQQIENDDNDTVEDVLAKLKESQSAEMINPSEYHAALSEILEMARRAKVHRAASVAELKGMLSRVKDLLENAKPRA